MKDKITIGILDQGVDKWWEQDPEAESFRNYYNNFEIECFDATGENNEIIGEHNYMVMDRLLEVCGNPQKIKVVNVKVFPNKNSDAPLEFVLKGLDIAIESKVDLLNLSIGIPRNVKLYLGDFLDRFNAKLDSIASYGGFTLIAAGNEGEVISESGAIIDNTNCLADNPSNNLSVSSHDQAGYWDEFSSVGGAVDVSARGRDLSLLGKRSLQVVSGTSFSTPSFTGVCANYLIDQFTNYTTGKRTAKEIIYGHLSEAIPPTTNKFVRWWKGNKDAWYGTGSFESYVKFFIQTYKRNLLRQELFGKNLRIG